MFAEARAPIVVAIRFLAATDSRTAPWVHRHLACGSSGEVRTDLAQAMVRASTRFARQLAIELDQRRRLSADQRAGLPTDQPVRYAGPVGIVLEPIRISTKGEPLPPPVSVEPHLRVFVTAPVPRCSVDATGAFGRLAEWSAGFMITASPSLELGWPTSAPNALGHRIVMATDTALTDGFCCGQEANFALDSLFSIYDFRDYQTKAKLRTTLHALATARQRDGRWVGKVRDAFGLPERYPASSVQSLQFGTGRIASGEFTLWPADPEGPAKARPSQPAALADMIMGLAWHAQSRAELISPALLESYDPGRKYSFVGWPEEFRETEAADHASDAAASAPASAKVLEIFGTDRKLSFVGSPESIKDNLAFAFAAWQVELDLFERAVLQPFIAPDGPAGEKARAYRVLAGMEADALARRRLQAFHGDLKASAGSAAADTAYARALQSADAELRLPGFGAFNADSLRGTDGSDSLFTVRWNGKSASLPARDVEQLRAGLRRLYRERFHDPLGEVVQLP